VAFKDRIILSSITLKVPETGVFILMGPCGTGKSTLLKTLAGFCQANPAHRFWGEAMYAGERLTCCQSLPAMVTQNTSLMMSSVLENIVSGLPERHTLNLHQQRDLAQRLLSQAGLDHLGKQLQMQVTKLSLADQRQLAILSICAANPKLILIDEPTTDLNAEEVERMVKFIKKQAQKRGIVMTTHNQKIAKSLGGMTSLIAGGWLQETQCTDDFFNSPITEEAKRFIKTGSCNLPSPNAKPENVNPDMIASIRLPPKEATNYKSHVLGPNGFLWLKKGQLAGTPRPGLLVDIEQDLKALKRVGITDLISLTERPINTRKCQHFEINVIASPVRDMQAPSTDQALILCKKTDQLLNNKRSVAIHCRAGLGRTGTLLACQLIYEGNTALSALKKVRHIEPRWIQSQTQVNFLQEFEDFLHNKKHFIKRDKTSDASIDSDSLVASSI